MKKRKHGLRRKLKHLQRRFSMDTPESFGLRLLAIYKIGYHDGYSDAETDADAMRLLTEATPHNPKH